MGRAAWIKRPGAAEAVRAYAACTKETKVELKVYALEMKRKRDERRRSAKQEGLASATDDPKLISKEAAVGDRKPSGATTADSPRSADGTLGELDGRHADNARDEGFGSHEVKQRLTLPTDESPEVKIAFERFQHELVLMFESNRHRNDTVVDVQLARLEQDIAKKYLSAAREILPGWEEAFEEANKNARKRLKSLLAADMQRVRADVTAKQRSVERAEEKVAEATARAEAAEQRRTTQDHRRLLALDDLRKAYLAFVEKK